MEFSSEVLAVARPIAQKAHDDVFARSNCLRVLVVDRDSRLLGDWVPFRCEGCGAEHRVSGLQIAKARGRASAG
jgi:hypothetical protein